jgi:hypothetical protein
MLMALPAGNMTFREPGTLTGPERGQLRRYLTGLIDAGLSIRTDGRTCYIITDRGRSA